jgi:hypothetical protein
VPVFDVSSRLIGRLTALLGLAAVWHYATAGLTLSHYDAKAHLVVSRRIFDSITPGWEQIGAVWLPLPHLINALPAQIDLLYRTGGFAIAVSVLSFAMAAAAVSACITMITGSRAGGALGAALFAANPNVLYLQSTAMTEPLLFGLTALAVLLMTQWALADGEPVVPHRAGWTIAAACLTRYEAWPVVGVLIPLAVWTRWRRGCSWLALVPVVNRLLGYPTGAVVFFLVLSRATVGEWFVSGGFYVPDETLRGQPARVWEVMGEGATALANPMLTRLTAAAAIGVAVAAIWRRWTAALLPLALMASAALPISAYLSGHPFRIRYEVPLVLASAVAVGLAVGLLRRAAPWVAIVVLSLVLYQTRPFDAGAPMVVEAQLDGAASRGRQHVTRCLASEYRGETVFASMGSLAHYMQELSHEGFQIRDFLHEGNHPIWDAALDHGPAPFAGWVLVEEVAEGGDLTAARLRGDASFLAGYDRVCEGGNVALYRRR